MAVVRESEDVAKSALIEIQRLYLRSNKRDSNTCYQMYLAAKKALEEIEYLKKERANDEQTN